MYNDQTLNCVLLHGWGINNSIWDGFVNELKSFDKVDAVCLYTLAKELKEDSVDALASCLKEKIEKNTVLIAWSFGGLVATRLASLSDNIKGIVFIASTTCFVNKPGWNNVLDKKSIKDLENNLLEEPKRTIEYFAGLIAHGDNDIKKTITAIRSNIVDEKYSSTLSFWLSELLGQDQRDEFAVLDVPTQYVLAECDALIRPKIINQLKQINSKTEYEILKNSCHAPFLSNLQVTSNLINRFISAQFK